MLRSEWRTILAYLHSLEVEDINLPLLAWQALRDLLVVLLWFAQDDDLARNLCWIKFQEVVMSSTSYTRGPFPDMLNWLLNVRRWVHSSFPVVRVPYAWRDGHCH